MPFSETQKKDVLEVLDALYSYSVGRRVLSTLFRELPDKNEWKEYYAVIPQPRCLDGVKVCGIGQLHPWNFQNNTNALVLGFDRKKQIAFGRRRKG